MPHRKGIRISGIEHLFVTRLMHACMQSYRSFFPGKLFLSFSFHAASCVLWCLFGVGRGLWQLTGLLGYRSVSFYMLSFLDPCICISTYLRQWLCFFSSLFSKALAFYTATSSILSDILLETPFNDRLLSICACVVLLLLVLCYYSLLHFVLFSPLAIGIALHCELGLGVQGAT